MNFTPFPEIKTERLLLRKLQSSDCEVILFLRTDKKVTKFIERPEHRKTKTLSEAIELIKEFDSYIERNSSISWGITLKNEPSIIGTICLWNFTQNNKVAEVGYDLDPRYQHKGFMSEALKAIVAFGFRKLKLEKIEAFTHAENSPSTQLLDTQGFIHNVSRKDLDNTSNIIFELGNPHTTSQ
ncbi:MAG: GNAT family N-acetyltransferase [Flavobacteriales bacterium]|nr:GNAT family N-acetyltransferase [Flavobacteriales bacterium]